MDKKNLVIRIIGVGAIFFLLVFFISASSIGNEVKNRCKIAQEKYDEDCVNALMKIIEDEKNGYREKNSAIWALGQMGDKRASPFLQKYYIGYNSKDKTKRDKALSQYELYKALKLLDGGFNATAFVWR